MVRLLADPAVLAGKCIVILRSERSGSRESVPDLDALHRADRHQRARQCRVQLLKHRLPDARGHPRDPALHNAPGRVTAGRGLPDIRFGPRLALAVGHPKRALLREGPVAGLLRHRHRPDGPHKGAQRHAELPQELLRDRTRRHTGSRLPPGRAAPAAPVPDTVFHLISIIRVPRPVTRSRLPVILRPRVRISHQQADRRAGRPALEHAGQDLHRILLLPRARESRSSRAPPVHILLNRLLRERQPRRASVDHRADRRPVRFPPGRHSEAGSDS